MKIDRFVNFFDKAGLVLLVTVVLFSGVVNVWRGDYLFLKLWFSVKVFEWLMNFIKGIYKKQDYK